MRNSHESLLCIIIIIAPVTMATTSRAPAGKKNLFTLRNRSERTNEETKTFQKKKTKQATGKRGGSANAVNAKNFN